MRLLDLVALESGNPDDFIVEPIGRAGVDCFQVLRQPAGLYCEILLDHGGPECFDGNRILFRDSLTVFQVLMISAALKMGMPGVVLYKFTDITERCKFWHEMGVA